MIQWLKNFAEALFDIINTVVQLLVSTIKGLFQIIKVLPSVISFTTNSISYLPSILVVFATLTITISVIYLMVGRETGS